MADKSADDSFDVDNITQIIIKIKYLNGGKIMKREEMLDNLMNQLIKINITDRATCLTILARIKNEKQYRQMMIFLTKTKNLTEEQATNKAIEISKN